MYFELNLFFNNKCFLLFSMRIQSPYFFLKKKRKFKTINYIKYKVNFFFLNIHKNWKKSKISIVILNMICFKKEYI